MRAQLLWRLLPLCARARPSPKEEGQRKGPAWEKAAVSGGAAVAAVAAAAAVEEEEEKKEEEEEEEEGGGVVEQEEDQKAPCSACQSERVVRTATGALAARAH